MMPRFSTRSSISIASAVREAELGFEDLVEVARPEACTSRNGSSAARQVTRSPAASCAELAAVDGERSTSRLAGDDEVELLVLGRARASGRRACAARPA